MVINLHLKTIFFATTLLLFFQIKTLQVPALTEKQAGALGDRIWQNECAGRVDQLTFWNKNEPFPSFGIGHFIWYPKDYNGPYTQTMPSLIAYLKNNGVTLPKWLKKARFCPWDNRNVFYDDFESIKMKELRELLKNSVALQGRFVVSDFKKKAQIMIKAVARDEQKKLKQRFNKIASSVQGLYALIDYFNFKGIGTNSNESYQGFRWGLLQVLQTMDDYDLSPCHAFVNAGKKVLAQRVAHAPAGKPEKQFLAGWNNRLDSYLK